jgi:hypothetical protein
MFRAAGFQEAGFDGPCRMPNAKRNYIDQRFLLDIPGSGGYDQGPATEGDVHDL